MNLYLKDPKYSTKKLLDTINTFSKFAGHKINLQKSVYTTNEQIKKNHSIHNSLKKYLRINLINLIKDVKYLYEENYKLLK
jgi:hypothetical protein